MPLRWLLVLDRRPTGDEFDYMYELKVYETDSAAPCAQPIAILHTADELVAMLFSHSNATDLSATSISSSR